MIVNGRVGEGHQLIEHSKLKLQLDAVHHCFQGGFDLIYVGVLHGQQTDIHANDDEIDPDQLCHYFTSSAVIHWSEEPDGRPNIYSGDYEFLYAEGSHLKLFHHIESRRKSFRGRRARIGSVGKDSRGYVETDRVDDDHSEDATQYPLLPHDKMQPRIENHRLPSDHGIPSNRDYSDREVVSMSESKELQQEPKRVQHTAIARYQERPEVQAAMSFEGEEDLDVELCDIVPRDCSEGSYCHKCPLVPRDLCCCGPNRRRSPHDCLEVPGQSKKGGERGEADVSSDDT